MRVSLARPILPPLVLYFSTVYAKPEGNYGAAPGPKKGFHVLFYLQRATVDINSALVTALLLFSFLLT